MEKAVANYIRIDIFELVPLLKDDCQIGKSTETALMKLTVQIQESLKNKETAVCVFPDLDDAFDTLRTSLSRKQKAQPSGYLNC